MAFTGVPQIASMSRKYFLFIGLLPICFSSQVEAAHHLVGFVPQLMKPAGTEKPPAQTVCDVGRR